MKSMRSEVCVSETDATSKLVHSDSPVSAFEKRRRLSSLRPDRPKRECIGHWLDERADQHDSLTLYREEGRYFLETWFSDGCHSLDEMQVTETGQGLKLEDLEGNFFAEFFLITEAGLEFRNDCGCYYTAPPREAVVCV